MRVRLVEVTCVVACLFAASVAAPAQTRATHPQYAHTKGAHRDFSAIDRLVEQSIERGEIPGAVVVIGYGGKVVFHRAYGMRSLEPAREPMTEETIFDMASLTKPMATATALMQLYQQGRFRLNDPVAKYLPEFAQNDKQDITIRDLMTHYSGLPPDVDLKEPWSGKQHGLELAFASTPTRPPGTAFRYSDINYIVLGALVEKLSGQPLDEYTLSHVYKPLGMTHTRFLPPPQWINRIAPTEYDEHDKMLRGIVHDPTSRRMGGVAGHAGLFSNAADVSIYAQSLLDLLAGRPGRFPMQRIIAIKMTTPEQPATGTDLRGLGWDIESVYSSNRGELFPIGSFGHTGFTGTSLWIDPSSNAYVIILANSVHPHMRKSITALRGAVATAAAAAIGIRPASSAPQLTGYNESLAGVYRPAARNARTLTGIDVIEAAHFNQLQPLLTSRGGKLHAALLTNATGVDRSGRRTIDVLYKDAHDAIPGFELVRLFSPEHGIQTAVDTEKIDDTHDPATGLPVVSLYGSKPSQRRPTSESLAGLDAIFIDLGDAGVRFYTYETALGYILEAAAAAKIEVIVLDRPNPIGGAMVQGPISRTGQESYVNYMPMPVRHGMTLGELARYYNGERKLGASLTVVAMQDWQRGDWFDSTGLAWINPSPNLRSFAEAVVYPGVGLIEGTNISVGRGTDTPFLQIGAPWIVGSDLARSLNRRFIPGIRFVPVRFTPQAPYPYAGQVCDGVELIVLDRNLLDAPEMGIELASALHKLYPEQFHIDSMATLLADPELLQQIKQGRDPQTLCQDWLNELDRFLKVRKPYFLY